MEIKLQNKMLGTYREVFRQYKRVQVSCEAVVPDTNEDIAKIAALHTGLLLKSKELSGRGVRISGEACTVLLYITEAEDKISALNIKTPFEIEYETDAAAEEALTGINLCLSNSEARILNPRKVAVNLEISGELSCFSSESLAAETELPAEYRSRVHTKLSETELLLPGCINEKSFTLNEQFTFPDDKQPVKELLYAKPDFTLDDTQHIGSKIIVKGRMKLRCCWLTEENVCPVKAEFEAPFSQIIESGEDDMESFCAVIMTNSEYYEIIETISGQKALDAEVHALIQFMSSRRRKIISVEDAYCNEMPCICSMETKQLNEAAEPESIKINREEELSLSGDCGEILLVFPSVSQLTALRSKISGIINLDIIYKTEEGKLSSARRIINIEEDCADNLRILKVDLEKLELRPKEDKLLCGLSLSLSCSSVCTKELSAVKSLELLEDELYDQSEFPSLSMISPGQDSIWELAKAYHSSVESIEFMNPNLDTAQKGLLLIPKEQ